MENENFSSNYFTFEIDKKLLLALFFITFSYTVQSQEKKLFPEDIPCKAINEYINTFTTDENNVRNKYFTILAFIDKAVEASYENIERAFQKSIFFVKCPALVNGKLTIVEKESSTNYIWDNKLGRHREIPNIDYVTESMDIILNLRIYNYLIDYWFTMKNELLDNYKDVDATINYIQDLIKTYQNSYN